MLNTCHLLVSTHAAAEVHFLSLFCHAVNAIFESRHGAKIITSNLHYTRYGYDINISILAGSKMVTYSAYLLVEIQCFNFYTLLSLCALVCPHYFVSRLDAGESGQQF